jgi:hypothetical protein
MAMPSVALRYLVAIGVGSGALAANEEFQYYNFAKALAAIAVIAFMLACIWRIYSSSK